MKRSPHAGRGALLRYAAAGALGMLALVLLWGIVGWVAGGPRVVAESESPDGVYVCRVTEYAPGEHEKVADPEAWAYDIVALRADNDDVVSSGTHWMADRIEAFEILWPGGIITVREPGRERAIVHLMLPWQ